MVFHYVPEVHKCILLAIIIGQTLFYPILLELIDLIGLLLDAIFVSEFHKFIEVLLQLHKLLELIKLSFGIARSPQIHYTKATFDPGRLSVQIFF